MGRGVQGIRRVQGSGEGGAGQWGGGCRAVGRGVQGIKRVRRSLPPTNRPASNHHWFLPHHRRLPPPNMLS